MRQLQADDLASPTGMLLPNLGSTLLPVSIKRMPTVGILVVSSFFPRAIKPAIQSTHGLLGNIEPSGNLTERRSGLPVAKKTA